MNLPDTYLPHLTVRQLEDALDEITRRGSTDQAGKALAAFKQVLRYAQSRGQHETWLWNHGPLAKSIEEQKASAAKPRCARCGENPATVEWGDALALTHGGGQSWCERCVTEEQTRHARERAAELPELERRLAELGGPAAKVCGCIPAMLTIQQCPVHGTVDYGQRYVDRNVAAGVATEEELLKEIGRD